MKKWIIFIFILSFGFLLVSCEPLTTLDTVNNDISATNDEDTTKITSSDTSLTTVNSLDDDISETNDTDDFTKDTSISTASTATLTTDGSGVN
ncbi:MAG: hypothetical protein JXB08_00400 [Bacilli bacterium]|nr:hypothetical protein [Bacilli bacterium]MBN2877981.1 hypothetical protein [Bacilli bacterium]